MAKRRRRPVLRDALHDSLGRRRPKKSAAAIVRARRIARLNRIEERLFKIEALLVGFREAAALIE